MSPVLFGSGSALPAVASAQLFKFPKDRVSVCLLGPWYGQWVHWTGRRSIPCLEDDCPKATHRHPQRWVGYMPGVVQEVKDRAIRDWRRWPIWVIGLPAHAVHSIMQVDGMSFPLLVSVSRVEGRKEVKVDGIRCPLVVDNAPVAFDVAPTLAALWGVRPPEAVPLYRELVRSCEIGKGGAE